MKTNKKKKIEWSKILVGGVVIFFALYGIWCGIEYYRLCKLAIEHNTSLPDAILAVTCVGTILGAVLSYCLYQFGLKNSRNKYGVDENGQPFKEKLSGEDDSTPSEYPEQTVEDLDKD